MALPKISEVRNLNLSEIQSAILLNNRELFDLELKKATRQSFKPHLFKHTKHRLSQLLMIEKEHRKSLET